MLKSRCIWIYILLFFPVMIPQVSAAVELKKLNLDELSSLGLTLSNDSEVKTEGTASLRITTSWPTTICLGEVSGLDIDNVKLLYQASVKSEMSGQAYLEMWVHTGDGQYFSRGQNDMVTEKTDWKKIQTPFFLQKGQKAMKVTLNLVVNGKGTIWVDDISLRSEPLQ